MKIAVRELTKRYGALAAVDRISFTIESGGICALIGPNGAGKTTLIRMLVTAIEPDEGQISYDGLDAVDAPEQVRPRIGYMPDFFGLYGALTVEEYLNFFARAYHLANRDIAARCEEVLNIARFDWPRDTQVETLSRGMGQKVLLAKTLLHDPGVLVLDEPASGLDPGARRELYDIVIDLARAGKTILLSSHILGELSPVSTQALVMQRGKVEFSGSLDLGLESETHSIWRPVGEQLEGWLRTQPECRALTASAGGVDVVTPALEDARRLAGRAMAAGLPVDSFEILRRRSLDDFFTETRGGHAQ